MTAIWHPDMLHGAANLTPDHFVVEDWRKTVEEAIRGIPSGTHGVTLWQSEHEAKAEVTTHGRKSISVTVPLVVIEPSGGAGRSELAIRVLETMTAAWNSVEPVAASVAHAARLRCSALADAVQILADDVAGRGRRNGDPLLTVHAASPFGPGFLRIRSDVIPVDDRILADYGIGPSWLINGKAGPDDMSMRISSSFGHSGMGDKPDPIDLLRTAASEGVTALARLAAPLLRPERTTSPA